MDVEQPGVDGPDDARETVAALERELEQEAADSSGGPIRQQQDRAPAIPGAEEPPD
jgi:hypothetical protein